LRVAALMPLSTMPTRTGRVSRGGDLGAEQPLKRAFLGREVSTVPSAPRAAIEHQDAVRSRPARSGERTRIVRVRKERFEGLCQGRSVSRADVASSGSDRCVLEERRDRDSLPLAAES
jgi:hypothetical protein